eukprot:gene4164-7474_t
MSNKPAQAYSKKFVESKRDQIFQRKMDKQLNLEKTPTGEEMKVYMESARSTKNPTNMWSWWRSLKYKGPKNVTFIHDSFPRFAVRQFTKTGTNHFLFSALAITTAYFFIGKNRGGWDQLKNSVNYYPHGAAKEGYPNLSAHYKHVAHEDIGKPGQHKL